MTIGWYPWLNTYYKYLTKKYHYKQLHHSILINAALKTGVKSLIWGISRWFFCINKNSYKSCGKCHHCMLMNSFNHPDLYIIQLNNNEKKIGVDIIKYTIKQIFLTSNYSNIKIIWIKNVSDLTKFAVNSLLKIIEEPPKNTFFFIRTENLSNVDLTFSSRCMLCNIIPPIKKISLHWLNKKTGYSLQTCKLALNLCNNLPIYSEKILKSSIWKYRELFFNKLKMSIYKKNLLILENIFNNENYKTLIDWICILLLDIIKYKKKIFYSIIHIDQKEFIKELSENFSYKNIINSMQEWLKCKRKLISIPEINIKLILIEQLMKWEIILNTK